MALIIEVDDLSWSKLFEREGMPIVVMFYSPTCSHCRKMEPYFNEYAIKFKGKVIFARANVMNAFYVVKKYGIMSTPTFKFFCDARPVEELVGAIYPPLLKKAIEDVLKYGKECAEKSTFIGHDITGYV